MKEKSQLRELLEVVVISVGIAAFLITFVIQAFYIPSRSMEPTLEPGDRILVNKFIYRFQEPKHEDVIVFKFPLDPRRDFIKRVIAVENDKIEIRDGIVYVNDKKIDEPYIKESFPGNYGPYEVPAKHLFMLGDNRNNSEDSRFWGALPRENVVGKAMVIYWPLTRLNLVK
mgnify:CR=1 FL=1